MAPLASVSPQLRLQLGRQFREGATAEQAEHKSGLPAAAAIVAAPITALAPAPLADVAGAGCMAGALEVARRGAERPTGPGDGPAPPCSGEASVMGALRAVQRILRLAKGFPPAVLSPTGPEPHPLPSLGAYPSPGSLPPPRELGVRERREGTRAQLILWHLEATSASADRGPSLGLEAGPRASDVLVPWTLPKQMIRCSF